MVPTGELVDTNLSLPVRHIHLLVACATLLETPTIAESRQGMPPLVNVGRFELSDGTSNAAPPDINEMEHRGCNI
jgi:hypothetical protein